MIQFLYHLIMKLITREIDCAVRAILAIAKSKKTLVTAAELSTVTDMPRAFLRKVLYILQQGNILDSCKGNNGGFSLACKPKEIFLMDLMRLFQGEINLGVCLFKKKLCKNAKTCPLRKEIKAIENYVEKRLNFVNIETLLNS